MNPFSYQVQFVYEWRSSWLAFIHYSNLGTIIFPSLIRLPSNFSSMQWIVMLDRNIYGLVLLHNLCSSMFWMIIPEVSSHLKLWTDIPCFIFPLRKAHGRYILASKDFIHPCLFASLWIILNEYTKIKYSHTIYLKIHHIYICIWKSKLMQTFVHRHGTCSRASALRN